MQSHEEIAMAKSKCIPPPPTRFSVGERFILNMHKSSGWHSRNGHSGVVVGPPEYREQWQCGSIDGSREVGIDAGGWRYLVHVIGEIGLHHFCETHMRKPRGERASTWAKFEAATGLRLQRGRLKVVRAIQSGQPSKTRAT
jgi:hypothetical protein